MYKQESVPVFDIDGKTPLMPTKLNRAIRWNKSGKATLFYKKGVLCARLNQEPSSRFLQPVVVGVDPGSRREGFSVKFAKRTFLNLQSHSVDWVSEAEEASTNARRARRFRKTPCRSPKKNHDRGEFLPPSTKARWQAKLRIIKFLMQLYPVSHIAVEDIKAKTWKGARQYNKSFSPLEVGKSYFYAECRKLAILELFDGFEDTYQTRQTLGLKKSKNKLLLDFSAHCVDSWVLAYLVVGGDAVPDNKHVIEFIPLRFHRRQLHRFQPAKGSVRTPYGGTLSMGFKRGGIAKHPKFGTCYIGGSSRGRVSLHKLETGKRLTQNAKPEDIKFLSFNSWRWNIA
jgi:hypothetical protein